VASFLDRKKTSDRNALRVLASTSQALGHDLSDISVSRSTIRRSKNRSEVTSEIKKNFRPTGRLVVHFDGKLLESIAGE